VINKWIPDEDLLEMSAQAYERGWRHVKLYFMIGLPTERDDDIEAIGDLTLRTQRRGNTVRNGARVHLGVSTFVPKPFTPFQWTAQLNMEETQRRQGVLRDRLGKANGIKFGRHDPRETFLEGLVTRGDRRAGDLLEAAFRNGARLDAWHEYLDFDAWERAIEETGFDVEDALRARDLNERLPWDHIDVLIPKSWFKADWRRAEQLQHAPDCRHSQCHRCGVIDHERDLCAHMLREAIDGAKEEGTWTPRSRDDRESIEQPATTAPLGARLQASAPPDRVVEPPPVQRVRFRVGRLGAMRFLSHLETANAWIRALRRAKTPLAYTQGFHVHPRVNFSTALPTAEESVGDWMDVILSQRVQPFELLLALQAVTPEGLEALEAFEVPMKTPSLMSSVVGHDYALFPANADFEGLQARLEALRAQEEWVVERMAKRKGRRRKVALDVRPMVDSLEVRSEGGVVEVSLKTRAIEGRLAKAREVLGLLGLDFHATRIFKHRTHLQPLPAAKAPDEGAVHV